MASFVLRAGKVEGTKRNGAEREAGEEEQPAKQQLAAAAAAFGFKFVTVITRDHGSAKVG